MDIVKVIGFCLVCVFGLLGAVLLMAFIFDNPWATVAIVGIGIFLCYLVWPYHKKWEAEEAQRKASKKI